MLGWVGAAQTMIHPKTSLLDSKVLYLVYSRSCKLWIFFFIIIMIKRISINVIHSMIIVLYNHNFINLKFDMYSLNRKNI